MSLLKRIVDAFKPEEQSVPDAPPFGVTEAAQSRLRELGVGAVIGAQPCDEGATMRLTVCEERTTGLVAVDGVDAERLRGLLLDWDAERRQWRFGLEHSLHASQTPNPNGRLYKANRRLAMGRPAFFSRGTINPVLVDRILRCDQIETVLLRDHTVTLERKASVSDWLVIDRHLDHTLREYWLSAGAIVEANESPVYADALEAEVAQVLEQRVLPTVHRDGGDLRLIEVREGVARLRMVGACRSCPSSEVTLHRGVEQVLRRAFPGRISGVEQA
ncbi:MAG: NifU family protein [Myxococcota bacterium]